MSALDQETLDILESLKNETGTIVPKDTGLVKNVTENNFNYFDIAKDMALSVPEAGLNFVEYTGDFLERNIPLGASPFLFEGWGDEKWGVNDFIPKVLTGEDYEEAKKNFNVDDRQMAHFHKAETWQGDMTERVSRFIFGIIGPSKFLRAAGLKGTIAKASLRGVTTGAIADATVWDPNEGRLSDWLIEFDSPLLNNKVTNYLASDEDDSAADAALKNVLEGAIPGIAAEAFIAFRAFKAAKRTRNIKEKEAIYNEAGEAVTAKQEIRKISKVREELVNASKELADETDKIQINKLTKKIQRLTKKITKVDFKDNKAINIKKVSKDIKISNKTAAKDAESFLKSILNTKSFKSGGHVLHTINQIAENFDDALKTFLKDDVLTNALAKDLAKLTADAPESFLKALPKISQDADQAVIRMLATKIVLQDLATQFRITSIKYAKIFGKDRKNWSKSALEEVALNAQVIRETVVGLKKQVRGAARTTQAGNAKVSRSGKVIDVSDLSDIIIDFSGDAAALANKVANLKKPEDILDALAKTRGQKIVEVANSLYINSLLSGFWTNAVNASSGLFEIAYRPLEIIGGGVLTADLKAVRLGFAHYKGMIMNFQQTWKMAGLAFKQGDAVLDPLMRTQDNLQIVGGKAVKPISAANLGFNGKIGTVVDWIGNFLELPSRLLLTGDELLKQINFNGRLYSNAVNNTLEKSYKMGSKDATANIKNIMDNGLLPNGKANVEIPMVKDAVNFARVSTFTNPLKDGSFWNWGSAIESFFNRAPQLRFIAPFIRTPTNLWRHYGNRIPGLGLFTKQTRELWKSADPRARAEVIGRQMLGISATIYAYDLATSYVDIKNDKGEVIAKLPQLTGSGPSDPAVRNLWRKTGWQPYSILVDLGNGKYEYQAYNRLDPRFFVLGIAADIAENERNIDEETKKNLFVSAVLSAMKGVGDKSYTRGVAEAFELMGDINQENLEKFVGNIAGNYVPYSSFRNQSIPFIKSKDTTVYETRDWVDKLLSKTGFTENLEQKRDAFGKLISKKTTGFYNNLDGVGGYLMGPWGIGLKSELEAYKADGDIDNKVMLEIASLKIALRPPKPIRNKIVDLRDFKNKRNETNGTQSAYDYWQEQIGKVTLNGRTIDKYLEAKMTGPSWDRRTSGDENFDGSKQMMIKAWHKAFVDKAYAEMLKKYPEVKKTIKDSEKYKGQLLKQEPSGSRLDKNKQDLEKILLY
nr:protein transporter sec31 [uncultured Mediterranean phage uvMED]